MNSEKAKEIKKALEDNKTDHLPYIDEWKCKFVEFADILTYINELESENERLEKELKQVVLCNKGLQDGINEYQADNKEIGKSNQQLKNRIAELEKENETKTDTITDLLKNQEFYETEKLKQFAEKLKKRLMQDRVINDNVVIVAGVEIDELLKEYEE